MVLHLVHKPEEGGQGAWPEAHTAVPQYLILACMAMVERERRGIMQRSGVELSEGGATASMRILRSFVLTSVLLLSGEKRVH